MVPQQQYLFEDCKKAKLLSQTFQATAIIAAIVWLFSFLFGSLVGVEMLGVFQLAYLSLSNNNFIPLYLSSLIPWFYYANGYNIKPTHFPDPGLFPKSVIAISYTNKFI